ncbi:MAG TPA: carboxypeptidase regulatory-like domain-containing protein [Terriglobales bacterium]|nr:carboxypeptidase regulatory-like domain-containing protein [Terriglobales bacterium]
MGAVGLGLLAAAALLGQSPGAVAGRVRDAGGAALAGVALRALRLGAPAGSATRALSDAQGRYRLAGLAPGRYQLRAAKAGFLAQQRTLAVRAGATAGLDWVLAAARPGTAPALRQGTVENTPLNGRDWTQLATLRPGVSGVETENASQGHVAQRGFGAALSISGSRPEENDYLLDGISISDYANGAPGSVVGTTLGVDAVQRMTVLDNNYPAAYGRTGGGIISAATRSGGDAWHGSLYEFLRNSALDARNFFDASKPAFRRNQFGGSLGGRVRPLRLHLFGDYEGLRQSLGITHVDTVPSVAARAGQLASGPVAVDAQAAAFLRALYPLPNGPALGLGDTGVYTFSGQQTTGENFFTTRADTTRGGRQFSAIYLFDGSEVTQPDAFNALLSNVTSRRQMVALSEEQALGGWSSVARVGFSRAVALDGGLSQVLNPAFTNPALGMVPGQFVGSISVPGLTSLDGGPAAGTSRLGSSKSFAWNSFQESEDLSRSFGGQTVQLGARVERMQSNVGLAADSNGSFQFGSLAAFLTNQPQTFSAARPMPVPIMGTRETLFGAYVEDALQLRPRFQLSLGMRYEMTTVPTEAHHRIANLQALTDPVAQIGSPYFLNPTLHNFAPRLGLTWQPWRSGAVVRSGFGIFDVLPLPYLFNIVTPAAYPYFQEILGSTPGTGTFPTGAYQQLAGSPSSYRTSYVEHHPHRSYVMQWNFSLQQRLGRQWAAMVGYVGSRSVHLPFRTDDFNTVMPTPTPAGYLYPPAATSQRLNPNFGRINGIMWNADAYYEALQATLRGSWRSGLQMQASYTWGKTMDTSSASITADQYDNSLVNMPWFNTRLDRGLSDLNMGQNFVANFTWALPGQSTGPWGWALAGWQWVGVVKAASGTPFTPLLGGDPLGTKLNAASEVPNWVNGPGCGSRVNPGNPNDYIRSQCFAFPSPGNLKGNVGRNTLIGPGLANLDFSLIKNTAAGWLGGDSSVQLRAEFFNLLNRADFAPPLAHLAVFDASGNPVAGAGLITATVQPAREVQLAVKLLW